MEIAFLIRIKERVGQHGLECEAFAASAADAICAERGDGLILAWASWTFTQIFVAALPIQPGDGIVAIAGKKNPTKPSGSKLN